MNIVNKGTYYSNTQLSKIIKKMNLNVLANELVICENRRDIFKFIKKVGIVDRLMILLDLTIWFGKVEGIYIEDPKIIFIFLFSQTDDRSDFQSKQLYSLHSIAHEMRHVWQERNKFIGNNEEDADNFAAKFINNNSKYISQVMNWEDEWEVEEE